MCGLYRLRRPCERYSLEVQFPSIRINGKWDGFETEEASAREDRIRAHLARLAAANHPNMARAGIHLAERLEQSRAPDTNASSRRMRLNRLRVIGALLELANPWPDEQIRLMTAIPLSAEMPVSELRGTKYKAFTERFRLQLLRGGSGLATGFLVGFIEGEYEPTAGVVRFHIHGLVVGGIIPIVEKLYSRPEYRPRQNVSKPLQLNRLDPAKTRAEAFSYLLKSYWKQRWIGPVGDDGEIKRQRAGSRLDEPYQTQSLLLFDRHSLCEMSLLMKVECRDGRLHLTDPVPNLPYMTRHIF